MAVSGTIVMVGAPGEGGGSGTAYLFTLSGTNIGVSFTPYTLSGSTMSADTRAIGFGDGVTIISEGHFMAGAGNSGALPNNLYNFRQRGPAWTPISASEELVPEAPPTAKTGSSVAIDGTTAAVGARDYDGRGMVFIFVQDRPVSDGDGMNYWSLQASLQSADIRQGDQFGSSVGLSGDTLIVGAPNHGLTGTAYLFQRIGLTWTQQAEFGGTATGGHYGAAVDIGGPNAIVGAPLADTVFFYGFDGSTWSQAQKETGLRGSFFGSSVALDAQTALIGAPSGNGGAGAAYVYLEGAGAWSLQGMLTVVGGTIGDQFGQSVDVSGDHLVVGAPGFSAARRGVHLHAVGRGSWTQDTLRLDLGTSGNPRDYFGFDVALDGEEIVIGAWGRTFTHGANEGAAYAFGLKNGAWRLETADTPLIGPDASGGDQVGYSVAFSGGLAIIGAPQLGGRPVSTDTNGTGYVYIRDVSPPQYVTETERQDELITGAKANTLTGHSAGRRPPTSASSTSRTCPSRPAPVTTRSPFAKTG